LTATPLFSLIIPVYNGGPLLARCLDSARRSSFTDWELLVVDDGSTDGSDRLAQQAGARVVSTSGRQGPAAARNLGAQLARGTYLFFTDADCELLPDTLARAAQQFMDEPQLEALFGSYDYAPAATGFIAQYKNLFHPYIHQTSLETASTFWTGCGAINRRCFLALGGFDPQRYRRPSVEDIELGYRLKQAGGRIRLVKEIQVKHLKAWTLSGLISSDILDRGIPWTQLLWRYRAFLGDLNLQTHNRISVVAGCGLLLALAATLVQAQAFWLAAGLALALVWLNLDLYRFFYRKRGLWFALKVIPLHWLYYLYNAVSFGAGTVIYGFDRLRTGAGQPVSRPVGDEVEPDRAT